MSSHMYSVKTHTHDSPTPIIYSITHVVCTPFLTLHPQKYANWCLWFQHSCIKLQRPLELVTGLFPQSHCRHKGNVGNNKWWTCSFMKGTSLFNISQEKLLNPKWGECGGLQAGSLLRDSASIGWLYIILGNISLLAPLHLNCLQLTCA